MNASGATMSSGSADGTGGAGGGIGRLVGGRYRLASLLGEGGMGAVYRAVHTEMEKEFAVKLLRPELASTEEAARRFEREAAAASRLEHPCCVRVTDFGRDQGTLFLVMERLEGRTLAQVLAAEGKLPVARAVHIAEQVLEAIAHAHGMGVVHRDLKPENVMLVGLDGDPDHVKICDFGLARVVTGEGDAAAGLTSPGTVFGTPEYLSPEQALGEAADGRADVYAIGVMLYEMLAGRRPFSGGTRQEMLAAHLTKEAPRIGGGVGEGIEEVVARALRKRKEERWQGAEEFRRALLAAAGAAEAAGAAGAAAARPPDLIAARAAEPEVRSSTIPLGPAVASSVPLADANTKVPPPPHRGWVGPYHVRLTIAAAAALVLLLIVIASISSRGRRITASPVRAPAAALEPARSALRKGELNAARLAAQRLAHEYPQDPEAFLLLGDALFAGHEAERALAAYREAARMERRAAADHSELLANLRATFGDRDHGEAAFALAEDLGPAAGPILDDFAAETRDPELRRRARAAAARVNDAKAAQP